MSLRRPAFTTTATEPKPSSRHFAGAIAVIAALVTLASAPDAAACDCAQGDRVEPSVSSTSVPSNTKVWVFQLGCETPELRRIDGTIVPTSMTSLDRTRVLHPDDPLEIGSTYEVVGCFGTASTFMVTTGPDDEPPARPSVSTTEPENGSGGTSSCGEYEYVPLLASQTDTILTLDIAGRAALDPEAVSGKVADVFFPFQRPVVGNEVCGSFNWSFSEEGDAVDTRLGAFDYAGNFSGWSEPETVAGGCGCEVAGAEPARASGYGIAALGLIALAVGRRRRGSTAKQQ